MGRRGGARPISLPSKMGIPRPPHPRGDETSCIHLNHGPIKCASPLASPTYSDDWQESIRRRSSILHRCRYQTCQPEMEVDESCLEARHWARNPICFFHNCPDASPLGLTAKPGVVCTTSIVPWVWVPQIELQHPPFAPFPVIYHGQLVISENLRSCPRHCFFGLSSARIVASGHDQ